MVGKINAGVHPDGVEVWGAFDCVVCDGENTVSERMWHGETWCSNCETEYRTELIPVTDDE